MQDQTQIAPGDLKDFIEAYTEAALFASIDDDGEPLDGKYELAPETKEKFARDCEAFLTANHTFVDGDYAGAGHDFFMTRSHQGVGFWDGDWPTEAGEILTEASHKFGDIELMVGDDGKIYTI